jgi:hypothetical protein
MKHVVMVLALALAGCASSGPKRSDLICGEERCDASIEQHPGHTDWYIVTSSECAIVTTAEGKVLPICGHEKYIGNGDIEIKPGSCRACVRQAPGDKRTALIPRSLVP